MTEKTLALTYDEIRRIVGARRGYGPTVEGWSGDADASSIVEDCLRRGARMFYNQSSHDWSFMKPVASLVIPSAVSEIALPPHFSFLIGKLYFDAGAGLCQELRVENAAKVLWRRQQDETTTGQPQYAAFDQRAPGATHGQRKHLIFWPISNEAYTVTGQFSVLADALSTSDPHPWGGPEHAETILQACLAVSEQIDGELGVQTALYDRALRASINFDKRVKPQGISDMNRRLESRSSYVTYVPGP